MVKVPIRKQTSKDSYQTIDEMKYSHKILDNNT